MLDFLSAWTCPIWLLVFNISLVMQWGPGCRADDNTMVVVAFGDSTTAPRGTLNVYANQLPVLFADDPATLCVFNSGVGGDDTDRARKRLEKDVSKHVPQWVIIQFGINDAAVDVWKQPPATAPRVSESRYEENLRHFITTLRADGAAVVLMTPNPVRWTPSLKRMYGRSPYDVEDADGFNVLLKRYAAIVRRLAAEFKLPLVDTYALFEAFGNQAGQRVDDLLLDGMHPNEQGHRLVANQLRELISTHEPQESPAATEEAKGDAAPQDAATPVEGSKALWLDPRCQPLKSKLLGPFVHTKAGHVLAIDSDATYISGDGGQSWSEARPLNLDGIRVSNERAMMRTRDGSIIAAYMNLNERKWTWKNELHDAPGAQLPTYVMRSTDDGLTWGHVQKMHDDWSGAVRDMIQTTDGRVVFTAMKMRHDPGRHSVLTYSSSDDGVTWRPSNLIDLGGRGHHGGVTEPTLTQLHDGRLWMLIRTNWGTFWSAYSHDGGRFWRVIQPSTIEASSSPAMLRRLASGRLMLLWNRPLPEGKESWPLSGGDGLWSDVAVSNHREELSLAWSNDDGMTWSEPAVIARQSGTWLAYPYVFEHRPGEIWITTMQGDVRVQIRERDFTEG